MNKTKWLPPRSFLNLVRQRRIFNQKRVRFPFLVIGCILILIWQIFFHLNAEGLDNRFQNRASVGTIDIDRFLYFYYYLGLFPVAPYSKLYPTVGIDGNLFEKLQPEVELGLDYSQEGARRLFYEQPDRLATELRYTIRHGEHGKIFLLLPSAWLNGTPQAPNMRYANEFFFVVALISVFIAFWWIRQPVLGALITIFMGSNSFELYEVYYRGNIFGWPIITALIILAIHLPVLTDRKRSKYYLWILPVLTGLILATIGQIRTEPITIIVSAAVSYLLVSKIRWPVKGAMVLLLVLSFSAGSNVWGAYFDYKYQEASRKVKEVGGEPFEGPRHMQHFVWHPIWCGLGDFDRKYGYKWEDAAALEYAIPVLNEKYNEGVPEMDSPKWGIGHYTLMEYWDKGQKYRKTAYEYPHYTQVLRDKIIHDITHDPLWYLDILRQRLWRAISETTPVRLSLGPWWITLPMHGILIIPLLVLLIVTRSWMLVKLVCFTLPLAFTTIFVYSGESTNYYSCYHLFIAAIFAAWLLEGVFWWQKNLKQIKRAI